MWFYRFGIVALAHLVFAPSPTQAQSYASAVERIYAGDWVIHGDFPADEPVLLGVAIGAIEALETHCPGTRLADQERLFLSALTWERFRHRGEVVEFTDAIEAFVALSAATTAQMEAARAAGRSYALSAHEERGCAGPKARFAENAARMAAGRRPAHGGPEGATLAGEKIEKIASRHIYDEWWDMVALNRRLAEAIEEHFGFATAVGLNVVVCHYDPDPASEDYVEQFHWGPTFATILHTSGALNWVMIPFLESQLRDAGAREDVRHPFFQLGPPRRDCPSLPDDRLQTTVSAKPRSAIVRAPAPSNVREPEVSRGGTSTVYDYGRVPDDFMPPVPDWREPCCDYVDMDRDGADLLVRVERLGNPFSLTTGQNVPPSVEEDYFRVSGKVRQADGSYLDGQERQFLLRCAYSTERTGNWSTSYYLWHLERPSWATDSYLRSRHPRHALLTVGVPIEFCPRTEAEVLRLMPERARRP